MSNSSLMRKIDAAKALQRATGFDGEADAASAAIRRLESRLVPEPTIRPVGLLGSWQRTAWLLLLSGRKWSERERDFLESMRCKRSAPSERQFSWLSDLKAKCEVHRADRGWG